MAEVREEKKLIMGKVLLISRGSHAQFAKKKVSNQDELLLKVNAGRLIAGCALKQRGITPFATGFNGIPYSKHTIGLRAVRYDHFFLPALEVGPSSSQGYFSNIIFFTWTKFSDALSTPVALI